MSATTTLSADAARLPIMLTELRLPTIKRLWPSIAAQSDREGWRAEKLLSMLLERLAELRGLPEALRMDNGPELIAQELADWCEENGVRPLYIQPGKPNQNAFIERYNRTFRDEVLDAWLFEDLDQVRELSAEWLRTYNEERPHDALGRQPPAVFRALIEAKITSTSELST
jgi:putative transposase